MKKVICDTNVWYSEVPKQENFQFLPTYCSAFELVHSVKKDRNIGGNISAIRRVAKSIVMKELHPFNLNPYAYIHFLDTGKGPFLNEDKYLKTRINKIASGQITKEQILNETFQTERQETLEKINQAFRQVFTKQVITLKNDYEHSINWTKGLIDFCVSNWAKHELGIDYHISENFDWNKIELFLNSLAAFSNRTINHKNPLFQKNDHFDLWGMVYVSSEDLYLTYEGKGKDSLRWHRLISEAGMSKYLYN